jgi:hypothetical protein
MVMKMRHLFLFLHFLDNTIDGALAVLFSCVEVMLGVYCDTCFTQVPTTELKNIN